MNEEEKNEHISPWWKQPWGYKESFVVTGGLIIVGWMLQLTIGLFNYDILLFPVNVMVMSLILIIALLWSFRSKSQTFIWLSGVPLSVSNIAGLLLYSLIMGFSMQAPPGATHSQSVLAFDAVTRSWSFILLYGFTLLNLSCVTVKRLHRFSRSDYAFYLNHLGLLLLLFAAGLGAADIRRYVMHVEEDTTEWRVFSDNGDVLELPVAIKLNDFHMEEYMPKLAIIDRHTGDAQPEGKPDIWQIDTLKHETTIAGWKVKVHEYIADAVRMSDSTFRQVFMPGSCPAVFVEVSKESTVHRGWVSSGNFAQLYMTLELDENLMLVMTRPEPSLFRSDVVVYTKDGSVIEDYIEVNRPLKAGHWMIYQYSYDSDRGKASQYSSFELVYDPWLLLVYIGLGLFVAGSVTMLWEGNMKIKKKKDDQLG